MVTQPFWSSKLFRGGVFTDYSLVDSLVIYYLKKKLLLVSGVLSFELSFKEMIKDLISWPYDLTYLLFQGMMLWAPHKAKKPDRGWLLLS